MLFQLKVQLLRLNHPFFFLRYNSGDKHFSNFTNKPSKLQGKLEVCWGRNAVFMWTWLQTASVISPALITDRSINQTEFQHQNQQQEANYSLLSPGWANVFKNKNTGRIVFKSSLQSEFSVTEPLNDVFMWTVWCNDTNEPIGGKHWAHVFTTQCSLS